MTSNPHRHRSHVNLRPRKQQAGSKPEDEAALAATLLGPHHRLTTTLERLTALRRQLLVTSTTLVCSPISALGGKRWAEVVPGSIAVVTAILAVAFVVLRSHRKEAAVDLIIDGHDLPLRAVARERKRLSSRGTRQTLATGLERVIATAAAPDRLHPAARPLFNPRNVRAVTPQLHELARALRAGTLPAGAAASVERLLTRGDSPLYRAEVGVLARELDRIQRDLDRSGLPTAR